MKRNEMPRTEARRGAYSARHVAFIGVVMLLVGVIVGLSLVQLSEQSRTIFSGEIVDNTVMIGLPAVTRDGEGVVGTLETTVKQGSGLVLVNIDNVLAQFDTQLSGRTAAAVATKFTGVDTSRYDIIYDINANATVIEGPSAGAAMAVSVIAALENRTLPTDVMVTGTINDDGTIGRVGAIREKALAAKAAGATTFLVPEGQGFASQVTTQRTCYQRQGFRYCEIVYKESAANVSSSLGINIIEVATIAEAYDHFRQ